MSSIFLQASKNLSRLPVRNENSFDFLIVVPLKHSFISSCRWIFFFTEPDEKYQLRSPILKNFLKTSTYLELFLKEIKKFFTLNNINFCSLLDYASINLSILLRSVDMLFNYLFHLLPCALPNIRLTISYWNKFRI